MTLRRGCLACGVVLLSWQALVFCQSQCEAQTTAGPRPDAGSGDRPHGFYDPSLAARPGPAPSHLSQAAAFLQKGDEIAACEQLGQHLQQHPEHVEVRIRFAELLLRQTLVHEARAQLVLAVAQAQNVGDKTLQVRVICHSMLMEIADAQEDASGFHLHRGTGLYLLALQRAKLPDPSGVLSLETLLCQAAAELEKACFYNPRDARPRWYLHLTWKALGQQEQANRWLHRASVAAPFSQLTLAEQRALQLAMRTLDMPTVRR